MITLDLETKLELVRRGLAEVVTEGELRNLLETSSSPRAYLGFEPSGLFHVGWLIWALKVKDLIEAGMKFILLEATWHAWINDKFGGDMELIKKDARYVEHVLNAIGVDLNRVEVIDAEELVSDKEYWGLVLKVAKSNTLARIRRALTIMGRKSEEAEMDASKLIYPSMQVADILYLDLDVALGGTDQRKAHMLARDTAEKLGFKKVVALHTPLLTGLSGLGRMSADRVDEELHAIELKMSKSRPESSIFVHDSPEDIGRKLMKAYCPPRQVKYNPVMEINKYILFRDRKFVLEVERPERYGGTVVFESYADLERAYTEGRLHPLDLKKATAKALADFLRPVREYFGRNQEAKNLLAELMRATITR